MTIELKCDIAGLATLLMTAFNPGQSPPPVRMPIRDSFTLTVQVMMENKNSVGMR